MQVQFALEEELRRDEFVLRALLFPPVVTLDVEPHQLSLQAREALAQCHPELPDLFLLLASKAEIGVENAKLWEIPVNPNAYAPAEVVEMWTKDFTATGKGPRPVSSAKSANSPNGAAAQGGEGVGAQGSEGDEDWAANVFDF
jgi:hypothetical protein